MRNFLTGFIERHIGLTGDQLVRLGRIVSISGALSGLNVVSYAVGSSLFVDRVGASGLPLSYVLVGLFSGPIYVWFAKIADQQARPLLTRRVLVFSALLFVLLRLCLPLDSTVVYYAIYVLVYFQWTLQLDVVLPSLISDYYTSREYNLYAPWIVMSQALGGIIGGGLVSVLAQPIGAETLLLMISPLALVIYWRVQVLERHEKTIDLDAPPKTTAESSKAAKSGNLNQQNQTDAQNQGQPASRLGRRAIFLRYPIVRLLAVSVFLWVVLYSLAEYQYFEIYSLRFENHLDDLTSFLGQFSAINSVAQLVALYVLTRKAIEQLGVRRLTVLYPFTTLLCFCGLSISPSFAVGIATNINSATIETTFNQPIHTLFYHPIPTRIVGTVRALCDGFSYSSGLLLVGVLLLLSQTFELPRVGIALFGVALSGLYLFIRYRLSEEYFKTLVANLGDDELDPDDVRAGFASIPATRVRELLAQLQSGDDAQQRRILQFLPYIKRPSRAIAAIESLIPNADRSLRQAIVNCWRDCGDRDSGVPLYLRDTLHSPDPSLRAIALNAYIVRQDPLSEAEVMNLIELGSSETETLSVYQNLELETLAHIAADLLPGKSDALNDRCDHFWQRLTSASSEEASTATATRLNIAIQAIRDTQNQTLRSRLEDVLRSTQDTDLLRQIFSALAEFALDRPRDEKLALAETAMPYLGHPDTRVRIGAIELLGALALPEFWEAVAQGLDDFEFNVRLKAASALSGYGEYNLDDLEAFYLKSPRPEVTEVAIAAIAAINTYQSQQVLDRYLTPSFTQIDALLELMRSIPGHIPEWKPAMLALHNYGYQIADRVLLVVYHLGDTTTQHTVKKVRSLLLDDRARERANAIEALASMNTYKHYITPILKILEFSAPSQPTDRPVSEDLALIERLAQSSDAWVAASAILICQEHGYELPATLGNSRDRILRSILKSLETNKRELGQLRQTFFLKTTQLFRRLPLFEIWTVVKALRSQALAENEVLVQADAPGSGLYILYRGVLQTQAHPEAIEPFNEPSRLESGAFFGGTTLMGGIDIPCPETIIANDPSEVLILTRENFPTINELMPSLAFFVTQPCMEVEFYW
jgi:HEAT repeat protein